MAICRIGYPNLFITFTCNPKWPEIQRYIGVRGLRPEDRPDIVSRVFKMKLDSLVKEFKSGEVFGPVKALIYTIEFQKRGLPHAHILLFLRSNKFDSSPRSIDEFISAKIPDQEIDKDYHKAVEEFMLHGPCGVARSNSPCMVNGRCTKYFPKRFVDSSSFDADGYPIYRRRNDGRTITKNGIQMDNRYVSASEATWRLLSYDIQCRTPAVERLSFHLPDSQTVYFQDDEDVESILNRQTLGQSMFTEWFEANKKYSEARLLIRGPQSFQDIKTYNGTEYNTFKDACYARGLLDDDLEYIDAIKEASQWSTAHLLRKLFVTLLMANTMGMPEYVWNEVWTHLAEDAQYNRRKLLNQQDMPLLSEEMSVRTDNRLILEELSYDRDSLAKESELLHSKLTNEQRSIYDVVIFDVYSNKGGLYFVYGYGGIGKTFLWRALSAYIRVKGQIVINVASNGIASLLLPGGRTAHSRFAIPICINEDSTCNIHQESQLAELIVAAKLIIWYETPMMHKHCSEALDRTMRDILRFVNEDSGNRTFGGQTVVFRGDFRKILPVVPKGSRQDIVSSTINSSYLWKHCKVMRLTKNLRLNSMQCRLDQQRMGEFANWLASIGDGTIGEDNDGYVEVDIPSEMLLKSNGDPIATIVNSTFLDFNSGISDGSCFHSNAILAPTLEVVNEVNEYMSDLTIGEGKTYYSSDTACKADGSSTVLADVYTPEFLNTIRASGLPNHSLTLKVGS
ncbi:uncharacterized protein LOC115995982 [Ipomoea triloba]|uniref:uncharacterized protein LOC115995982 n=1 Tax=Ipomoea triloba TaxID=35885 RepID=UPI00125DAC50|nr:uncharacterized protein LOC115995982 [Ipomoea triloba]